MTRHNYRATATREGRWWLIVVDGIGATQARTLDDAPAMAADMVAAMLDVPVDEVEVDVEPKVPDTAAAAVTRAEARRYAAARMADEAADAQRAAARALRAAGLSGRDVGALLGGLTKQRVSQLTRKAS